MLSKLSFVLLFILGTISMPMNAQFLEEQKTFERVRAAIQEKENFIEKGLQLHNLTLNNLNLLFVAYKDEDLLEIYAKSKQEEQFKLIYSYKIYARSGQLGPKRKSGDKQVPEGFYYIDRFNPASKFHLSLGLNYPNDSDQIKSNAEDLGGDIFIHGDCKTTGCLPMTDDKMKEIYVAAMHAYKNGQVKIPVYVFPFRMDEQNFTKHEKEHSKNVELIAFWKNLKVGYDLFFSNSKPLKVRVNEKGDYLFM